VFVGGVQPNGYNVAMLNGGMGDASQVLQVGHQPGGVVYNNLVPLGQSAYYFIISFVERSISLTYH